MTSEEDTLFDFELATKKNRVQTLFAQTEIEPFRALLAGGIESYHQKRKNVELGDLMRSNAEQAKLIGKVRAFMGEENYAAMIEGFAIADRQQSVKTRPKRR